MRFVRSFAVAAFVTSITSLAWADMPGGTHCDAPSECTVCSQSEFGSGGGGGASQFDMCVAQAEADGLHLSCSDFTGSDENKYWCPPGIDATEVTSPSDESGGGSGCSASGGGAARGIVVAAGIAFAGAVMAMRKRAGAQS